MTALKAEAAARPDRAAFIALAVSYAQRGEMREAQRILDMLRHNPPGTPPGKETES